MSDSLHDDITSLISERISRILSGEEAYDRRKLDARLEIAKKYAAPVAEVVEAMNGLIKAPSHVALERSWALARRHQSPEAYFALVRGVLEHERIEGVEPRTYGELAVEAARLYGDRPEMQRLVRRLGARF